MSLLELAGTRYPIPVGEVVLGSDPSCAIRITGPGILARHAVLQGQADGAVVIRKAAPAAEVLINGVRLGAEPTPLLHGDKVEAGGQELTFVDERRSGSTQFVQALTPAPGATDAAGPATGRGGAKAGAVGTTGGRVVSLTDGREYVITGVSLVFGREAGCDVVVTGKDVSRRHGEIVPTPKGYLLVDSSTNGTFVNEERVQGQRILARADVIRIGEEQFRFYADVAPAATAPPPSGGPAASAPRAGSPPTGAPPPVAPPPGAGERLKHTIHGVGAPAPSQAPPGGPAGGAGLGGPTGQGAPFANFLFRGGVLKGQRLSIKTPHANIGRADYNDLVIPDPSVSTSHAKLQRREGVWVLLDLDSTNGSFVDGERVTGEAPLAPGALVRFGDVELLFEPRDDAPVVVMGGGTQLIKDFKAAAPPAPPAAPAPPKAPAPPRPAPPGARPGAPPPGPKPAPKPATRPAAKPASKRPGTPAAPEKKGKGCGGSAAALVLAGAGLVALVHRLLA
jgi:pSer/pThr/pTyr-binding forkhead associated (FHA) protein